MKIGIDISQIVHGTGVSFYTRNLVRGLARVDQKNDYLLFGSSLRLKSVLQEFAAEVKKINKNFSSKIIVLPPTLAEPLWNRWRFLSIERLIGPIDVFHSSDWTQPPTKAAKVTTIHDFGFLKYPDLAHPKVMEVMERRLKLIKKEVDLIVSVSEATAKDIVEILGIPRKKIRVVYEAPAEEHRKISLQAVKEIKKKIGIKEKYLLAVANLDPRKNLRRIIEAYGFLHPQLPGVQLVIAGQPGWEGIEALKTKARDLDIVFAGYVTNQDLAALYTSASCLVYPSLYEGFGLPILGAMACGCPVVTSNVSSMPEVAGNAAVLVDPENIEDIARGIKEAMERKKELIKKGFERAKQFSWEKTAKETLEVYNELHG